MTPLLTRLALSGAAGRMGRMIAASAKNAGVAVVCGIDRAGDDLGFPVVATPADALVHAPDVIIDFSSPAGAIASAEACARSAAAGKPVALVVGTTGLGPGERARVAEHARAIPLLIAPNTSIGVNVLYRLLAEATRLLGPAFDVAIVEGHHKHKKDRPSGTALAMVAAIEAAGGNKPDVAAFRGGEVVGEHTAYFLAESERIEITHRASSRSVFADGAVRAARWLAGKPAGLYEMKDVLGIA